MIKYLVEHGADINIEYKISECRREPGCYYDGITPLIIAIRDRNESKSKYLVEHGANVNDLKYPGSDYTILSVAVNNGNNTIADYLIKHGAQ
ncbi:hypothetical protein BCR32DRAFT_281167 [Anaeromyces robustus]|uniref:Uncharacterized protein n=1 Tax=Anaeromyces robustus TaxID=1754192 RepID=A0A1Y1X1Q7_9FUNG|nr:hypothetical protein BCR32DRAFT_281167 [Anaeromyces robustus]|eukprot:ORX79729.1 hypothetical protein BCR32DRAFT_281167 [Anaeromyces robustus]